MVSYSQKGLIGTVKRFVRPRIFLFSLMVFSFGFGVYAHDSFVERSLGHIHEGVHGLDVGVLFMIIGYGLLLSLKKIKKERIV